MGEGCSYLWGLKIEKGIQFVCPYFQIEQDVALVIGQNDTKSAFFREWTKYITGILTYGEKSTKKDSMDIIRKVDNTGMHRTVHIYIKYCPEFISMLCRCLGHLVPFSYRFPY